MTTTRTTHRSTSGTKLYAVRKRGKFADIQTHKRSSRQDQRQKSEAERTTDAWAVYFKRTHKGSVRVCEVYTTREMARLYANPFNDDVVRRVRIEILNAATRAAARKRGKV